MAIVLTFFSLDALSSLNFSDCDRLLSHFFLVGLFSYFSHSQSNNNRLVAHDLGSRGRDGRALCPISLLIIKLRVYVIEVLLTHLCDGERA